MSNFRLLFLSIIPLLTSFFFFLCLLFIYRGRFISTIVNVQKLFNDPCLVYLFLYLCRLSQTEEEGRPELFVSALLPFRFVSLQKHFFFGLLHFLLDYLWFIRLPANLACCHFNEESQTNVFFLLLFWNNNAKWFMSSLCRKMLFEEKKQLNE
jgi:hypothetical protein